MRRLAISLTCLALVSSVVVGGFEQREVRLTLFVDGQTLDDVLGAIETRTGYAVQKSDDVDGDMEVELSAPRLRLESACYLLAEQCDLTIVVNHTRKEIEVLSWSEQSAHIEERRFDVENASRVYSGGRALLYPDKETDTEDSMPKAKDFARVVRAALGLDLEAEYGELKGHQYSLELDEPGEAAASELFKLLGSDDGGRSAALERQHETWRKLNTVKLTFNGEKQAWEDFRHRFITETNTFIVTLGDAGYMLEEAEVDPEYQDKTALEVLKGVLPDVECDFFLYDKLVAVVPADYLWIRRYPEGYMVYELTDYVDILVGNSDSDLDPAEALQQIVDGIYQATGHEPEDGMTATWGTRLVLRGDLSIQQAARSYLKTLAAADDGEEK